MVNTKGTCSLSPLSYLRKHAYGQSHLLPYHWWLGITLLPIVFFFADGAIAIVFFLR